MNEKEKLASYVKRAFEMLYKNDSHLIYNGVFDCEEKPDKKHHVGERSIVFRYAHYLQNLISEDELFKEYNLDCEYNRNGAACKGLPSFPKGTYPDLIIHKRGSNKDNLLVMEFKTYWNDDREDDKKKIREFMNPTGKYRYKYGISALIKWNEPICDWITV